MNGLVGVLRWFPTRGSATGTRGELPWLGSAPYGLAALAVLTAALAVGAGGDRYQQTLVGLFGSYVVAALGYTLLIGYSGQLAFGHAAFMAIGAYTYAVTQAWHVPGALSVALALVVSTLVALLVGTAVLRTSHFYLALVTLGFAEATLKLVTIWKPGGGENGIGVDLFGRDIWYIGILGVLVSMLVVDRLTHSRFGRAMAMVRSDEVAATAMGVGVRSTRVIAFSLSGALGGLGGVLLSANLGYITPANFSSHLTLLLLVMIVVGGLASIWGAFLGTLLIVVVDETLTLATGYQDVVYGLVLFAVLVLIPNGVITLPSKSVRLLARVRSDAPLEEAADEISGGLDIGTKGTRVGPGPGAETRALLRLEGVTVRFGGVAALREVSVAFRESEITAIIGPNGAGKTTLLNVISGLIRPASGRVELEGRRVDREPACRRASQGIARTFQHSRLFPGLTVLDQLLCGGYSRGRQGLMSSVLRSARATQEERLLETEARDLLATFGLQGRELAHLDELPGGHRRLVDLGRGLMAVPRVILLDEIAAGMTDAEKRHVASVLRQRHHNGGLTIVLIEHDLEFVRELATSVVVLDRGQVLASGPTEEVLSRPDVLAAYVGES